MGFKETVPEFRMIDVAKIAPDPAHPRRQYDEAGLKRLADSISGVGVIQPIVVQPADAEGKFRLIVGERRLRAALLAGEAMIPALVRACPAAQTLEVQVFENLGQGVRLPLAPREMAQALKTIARGFDSPEAAADHFGQPATWLEQKTAPANLSPKVEALLDSGQITSCTTAVQLDKLVLKNEARLDALVAEVERGEKLPKKAVEAALVAEGVKRAKKPAEPDPIAEVVVPRSADVLPAAASARRVNPGKVRMVAQILGLDDGDEAAVIDRLIDEFLALKGEGEPALLMQAEANPAMRVEDLRARLLSHGAKPIHEQRLLRAWVNAKPLTSGPHKAEDCLPLALRNDMPALEADLQALARLRSEHPGEDGSARLLVELADGQTVESVLLPRDGLCVSTQVGCAVGCVFCMTGRDGLLRQLGSAEIVAQVVLARSKRFVKKVVFMGMGEPAHNLDNVLEAIDLLGTAGGIGHKNLVFSTVGDPRVFERLPLGRVKPALALSLHTTKADLRAQLLPRAPRIDPADLVAMGEHYARTTGYPIQYQWTLIDGVNDGDDELDGIVSLLAGKYAIMNMIPYNTVPELEFRRPAWDRATAIARVLHQRGVLTKLRNSAGQDVDGGCGQLRARDIAKGKAEREQRIASRRITIVPKPG